MTNVADNSESSVTLYVINPTNFFEFDSSEFVVTPVTDCVISSYSIQDSLGAFPDGITTDSPVGPDSDGKYKVYIMDNQKLENYSFFIVPTIIGGHLFTSSEKRIITACNELSFFTMTDPNLVNETLFSLG